MRAALDRLSSLLVGWIPDLSRVPLRHQVALGLLVSLLLHLLLLLGLAAASLVFPHSAPTQPPAPEPEQPSPLQVELVPMPPPPQAVPDRRPLIDPRGLKASAKKPENIRFESSQDMVAGSEQPPNGALPLPTQEGETSRPSTDFADQKVRLALKEPASPALQPQPEQPAAPPSAPPPLYQPNPVSREELASATTHPEEKLPEPAKAARATPPPLEKVTKPREDQMVVARLEEPKPNSSRMRVPPTPVPRNTPARRTWEPMLSTPKPFGPTASERYQESLRKTRVEGTISNRGEAGVDAVATSAGRWWMLTKNAIGQNWYLFTDQRRDMVTVGSVRVAFTIDAQGKLSDVRVEASTGNSTLVEVCLKALRETRISPPPPDVLEPLQDQKMDQAITFTYF